MNQIEKNSLLIVAGTALFMIMFVHFKQIII